MASNEGDDVADRHAERVRLEGAAVLEDGAGRLVHRGIRAAEHVVGVDDHLDAMGREIVLGDLRVGARDGDERNGGMEAKISSGEELLLWIRIASAPAAT